MEIEKSIRKIEDSLNKIKKYKEIIKKEKRKLKIKHLRSLKLLKLYILLYKNFRYKWFKIDEAVKVTKIKKGSMVVYLGRLYKNKLVMWKKDKCNRSSCFYRLRKIKGR